MELINNHFTTTIPTGLKAGYAKIGTVHFGSGTTITGIPNYQSCSFNIDLTCYGNLYKTGKPFAGKFFVYIKGNDSNPVQIDLYYDNRDMWSISNDTNYDIPSDTLQFVANYYSLDTSVDRPQAICDIDIYLKTDVVIVKGYNISNLVGVGMSYENNLVPNRDIVTTLPIGNVSITFNKYNKANYRKIYTNKTSGVGYTSTSELIEINDPVNRIMSYHGKMKLNAGFTIGGLLDNVPSISSKYSPLTQLHFTVGVIYLYGNYSGTGIVRVTNTSGMYFQYYDRMDTKTIDNIDSIVLTGVSWEY